MMSNQNAMLQINNNAMKSLHDVFGYDFMRFFEVLRFDGKITVNKIRKAAEACGFTPANSVIVALMTDTAAHSYHRGDLTAARITASGIDIDFRAPYKDGRRGFDHFITKSSFDDLRKIDSALTFVVCQRSEYLQPTKKQPANMNQRFRFSPDKVRRCGDGRGNTWHSGIWSLTETERNNKFDYEVPRYSNIRPATLTDIIDKSGYLLVDRRRELKRRADQARKEHEKAAYMARNDSAERLLTLANMVNALHDKLTIRLATATTSEALEAISNQLCSWRGGFDQVVRDFERFQERTKNRAYASPAEYDAAYNNLVSLINANM